MELSSERKYLLWGRQQQADKARIRRARRDLMTDFALVFSVVSLTIAGVSLLSR
jgi:hypothetical protein